MREYENNITTNNNNSENNIALSIATLIITWTSTLASLMKSTSCHFLNLWKAWPSSRFNWISPSGKTSRVAHLSSLSGSLDQTFTNILLKIIVFFSLCTFQSTFHYDSQFWRNRSAYNLPGGETGFDLQETKLPTYWICLGMKIDNQLRFIVINKQVGSLHSLIADGKYRNTSLGRKTWRTLIGSAASLQRHCNMEGFNAMVKN